MQLPIIVIAQVDYLVYVYDTVQDAECDLEPIDVENQEYIAIDASGRSLRIYVEGKTFWKGGCTRISESSEEPGQHERWTSLLRKILPKYGISDSEATSSTDTQLLQLAIRVGEPM